MIHDILASMTVDTLIIFSGALVVLLPFLGFPDSWDTAIFFVLGSLIVGLGIMIRRRKSSTAFPHSDDIRSE